MFQALTDRLQASFKKLRGQHKLTEENISEAVREVRLALLEADVNYRVAKEFVQRVKEKALGEAVLKSVSPAQQFIKCVHDELVSLMGGGEAELDLTGKAPVLMLCGLQGSGKTTHAAKIAHWLKKKGRVKNPLLVALDLQRPAAVAQLETLGKRIEVPVFSLEGERDPRVVAKKAVEYAREHKHDLLIADTAGRLHLDEALMKELDEVRSLLQPKEILFVANATIGQDATTVAAEFNRRMEISGSVLTMLDGNARAGAAISIREVTGKPLVFEGIGEGINDLQLFNPTSMAHRILGMGDTINLVELAQEHFDEEEAKDLEAKLRKASFSYRDYLSQIQMVKKMGSFKRLLSMVPGIGSRLPDFDEKELFKIESIILSMTKSERDGKVELLPSRRRRIAKGSGRSMEDVNRLIKSFKQAKQLFKKMPNLKQMEKMFGGKTLWQ